MSTIKTTSDPVAWNFAGGKISALEAELLPRAFFEGLLKCRDRAEARGTLGKTVYRSYFHDDKSLDDASAVVDARFKEIKTDVFRTCPPHPLINFFGIWDRHRSFRTLFNQACKNAHPPAAEMENLFSLFALDSAYNVGLREHLNMLSQSNSPQTATPLERSLYLDSAAASLMAATAESTPEPLARHYMRDCALLTAWSAIFRLRWSGVPADVIRKWYVFENSTMLAASILATESDPHAAIHGKLSPISAMVLERMDIGGIRRDIDAAAAEILRDTVLQCRLGRGGPERVLAYLVAIQTEMVNLALCLSAIANDIDRDVALSRLRREYA